MHFLNEVRVTQNTMIVDNYLFPTFSNFFSFVYRCSFEHCQIMDREVECLCYNKCTQTATKLEEIISLLNNSEMFACITDHPGFQSVCLDSWVLQTAWLSYKQHYENV